jgi:hypothetical protein
LRRFVFFPVRQQARGGTSLGRRGVFTIVNSRCLQG